MKKARVSLLAITVVALGTAMAAQHDMPAGMTHEQHMAEMKKQAEMKKRGNVAMGFDQDKTTHHFFLRTDGGVIQVESNDDQDTTSRDQIRTHLKRITEQFAKGDFSAPFATHQEVIPGVAIMQRSRDKIKYQYDETQKGAAVRIATADAKALSAIHQFLKYQIREHATGDPLQVN